jgi:two-component system, NarL family, sensor kinase
MTEGPTAPGRLLVAFEEERRRLRWSVRDSLEPALAGMAMQVYAARRRCARCNDRTVVILDALAADLRASMAEVRALGQRLRTPALDHGFLDALRAECRAVEEDLAVGLTVDGDLDGLPTAVEVVAHRVVADALCAAVAHRMSSCRITVRRAACLTVEIVVDEADARVLRLTARAREETTELGGIYETDGAVVRVILPI